MLNHKFTKREQILLLILAVLLIGILYYKVAWNYFSNELEKYSPETLQTEVDSERIKLDKMRKMSAAIEESKDQAYKVMPEYNAQAREIRILQRILSDCKDVSVSWNRPSLENDVARRNASISFSTSGYKQFRKKIKDIDECELKCLIRGISYNGEGNGAAGSVEVIFFENTRGIDDLSGIEIPEQK